MAPAGATDCHFHIFGPKDAYPLSPQRHYEPAEASIAAYRRTAATLGIERAVVVTASPYGTDNRCTLDAIAALGLPARGVAVIAPTISDEELQALHQGGIRGIRINTISGATPLSDLPGLAARVQPFGMHVQLWTQSDGLQGLGDVIERIDGPVVIDHMGQIPASFGLDHPHFRTLMALLKKPNVWIKLIGYRTSAGPPYADLRAPAREILGQAGDRCLWGSDWPHAFLEGRPIPDAGELLDLVHSWCSDEELRMVMVANPARLYGFDEGGAE